MKNVIFGVLVVVALSGCVVGIKEDGKNAISSNFHVPVTYQEAYRRADAFAHHCRTSTSVWRGSFNVTGNLYTDNQTAVVHISDPGLGKDLERIEMAVAGSGGTDVTVKAWGTGVWDERELAAAQRSIESGTPSCR